MDIIDTLAPSRPWTRLLSDLMVVASDVFPLVHALLTSAGLKKSAAALAKEAKLQPKAFKREHDCWTCTTSA